MRASRCSTSEVMLRYCQWDSRVILILRVANSPNRTFIIKYHPSRIIVTLKGYFYHSRNWRCNIGSLPHNWSECCEGMALMRLSRYPSIIHFPLYLMRQSQNCKQLTPGKKPIYIPCEAIWLYKDPKDMCIQREWNISILGTCQATSLMKKLLWLIQQLWEQWPD